MIGSFRRVPSGVVALGFVSLLMDVSSEMIHALLPIFMVTVLGASATGVGIVEGIAEATASVVKVFSGALSDRMGRRKPLLLLGYGMAALSKPAFPLAGSVAEVLGARFIDRVGKGIRGAPRDALIADITPPEHRGAAYGLRQSMDSVGAILGPLAAIALLWLYAGDMRAVFWWAVLPGLHAVLLLALGVREPARQQTGKRPWPLRRAEIATLPRAYWIVLGIGAVFALARFSEAFLILRAQADGLAIGWLPLVLVGMNIVYAVGAMPAGVLSDRIGRGAPLLAGMAALIAADLVLAFMPGLWGLALGVALWGLHLALTQGQLAALVADTAPEALRGTAFGVFNLATGAALLPASVLAGLLWDMAGPRATFLAGAGLALLAALALLAWRRRD